MSFTSLPFIFLFLPIACILFYTIPYKQVLLALISAVFLFLLDQNTFYILLPLLAIGYLFHMFTYKYHGRSHDGTIGFKIWMTAAVTLTVLPLLVCKYTDFFARSLGIEISFRSRIIVPIGISFFTFRQIMVIVDSCKKNINMNPIEYISYVLFFPQITSGPIERPQDFLDWVRSEEFGAVRYEVIAGGIVRVVTGMAKKILIANTLSNIADVCFAERTGINSTLALFGILGYSLQIYFDFSGYSDMAIGIANILGFRSCENFDSPYRARTIGEFWKRWHLSLTKFFTYYIYIPLGGNRKGLVRTCLNIMIIFLISGLWHGADWKFILWGAVYGLILVIERIVKMDPEKFSALPGRIAGRVVTMIVVSLLWTLFRADTIGGACSIIREFFRFDFHPVTQELMAATYIPEIDLAIQKFGVSDQIYAVWPYVLLGFSLILSQLPVNSRRLCEKK